VIESPIAAMLVGRGGAALAAGAKRADARTSSSTRRAIGVLIAAEQRS
jgi:hypothetical protein